MARSGIKVLQKLLKEPPTPCAVLNRYYEEPHTSSMAAVGSSLNESPVDCFLPPEEKVKIPPSPRTREGLLRYYVMNPASVCAVLALDLQPDDSVLDMCAAPGGKSFVILQQISLRGGLAVNDPSPSRMMRLKGVVRSCVPPHMISSIRFTRRRGEQWGEIERNEYDKVLVDAPCSSDRDGIHGWTKHDQMWPNSTKLAALQLELFTAGLHALKPDGTLVYSTCTLNPSENDDIIKKALERSCTCSAPHFKLEHVKNWHGFARVCAFQDTEFGTLVVPCEGRNSGPAYIAKIRKLS